MRMVSENRRIFDAEREQLIEAFKRDHDSAKLLSSTSAATDRAVLREFAAHTLPASRLLQSAVTAARKCSPTLTLIFSFSCRRV
jgi:hypothetical protein